MSWREQRMLGVLTVEVVKVWDLKNLASFGKMNPQVSIAVNRDKQHTRTIDGGGVACEFHQVLKFNLDCQSSDVVHVKINHDGVIDKCVGVFSVTLENFINKVQQKRVRIQVVDEDTLTHPTGMIELIPDYHGTNDTDPEPAPNAALKTAPTMQADHAGHASSPTVAPTSVAVPAAAVSYPQVAAVAPAPFSPPQQPYSPPQPVYQSQQPVYQSQAPVYQSPQAQMYASPPQPVYQQPNYSQVQVQQPMWAPPPQFQQSAPIYGQPPMQPQQQQQQWQPQYSSQQPQMQYQQQHPPQRAGPPIAYPVHAAQPQPPR